MKKLFLVGTILFCAAVLAIIVELVRRSFEKPGSPSHLKRIAAQINGREDKYIGNGMEMTSAQIGDKRLTIVFTLVTMRASEVDPANHRRVRELMRKDSCSKKALRDLLENGVTLSYIVRGIDGAQVMTTEILAWECTMDFSAPSSR